MAFSVYGVVRAACQSVVGLLHFIRPMQETLLAGYFTVFHGTSRCFTVFHGVSNQ